MANLFSKPFNAILGLVESTNQIMDRRTSRNLKRVSVVVNTNGRSPSLAQLLDCLERQRYPFFEVCVVCGPADDGTRELVEARADRVKAAHCDKLNLSRSRNIGLATAAGDYVAFIDDD